MVIRKDDRPESPDEIPTSSRKDKHWFSLERCGIASIEFPEELVYEVILRLPVKSLIRFRSVSKGMLQLIDSSSFITKHSIRRSIIRDRARSVPLGSYLDDDDEEYAVLLYKGRPLGYYSLNFDDNDDNRGKAIELNCNFVVKEEGMNLMYYCCNGIFCFTKFRKSYVFWNPSNGTFRKVDSSSCPPFRKDSMGYDNVNDDYKIIGLINNEAAALQIYSLRNDSWRKLVFSYTDFPSGQPCYSPYSLTRAICVGGVMHWMWIDEKSVFIIVAFNLATETFTTLPLPLEARQLRPCHFTDFRGRLCVTFEPPGYPSRTDGPHTMWVMEKYGVETSWFRLYNYNILFASFPNFYFPNSRRRLLCLNSQYLCWWDPQQDTFERIEITGLVGGTIAHVYVRNLVRLDQGLV